MIEFTDFLMLIHQINETFGIAVDWFSDTFVQVGLGVVIWTGYVRHWVSFAFQCLCRMINCFSSLECFLRKTLKETQFIDVLL